LSGTRAGGGTRRNGHKSARPMKNHLPRCTTTKFQEEERDMGGRIAFVFSMRVRTHVYACTCTRARVRVRRGTRHARALPTLAKARPLAQTLTMRLSAARDDIYTFAFAAFGGNEIISRIRRFFCDYVRSGVAFGRRGCGGHITHVYGMSFSL